MKKNRRSLNGNRRTQLHSLIDMAFILLIFFLITSLLEKMGGNEQKLAIPTPKNEAGQAQLVIQIIDPNRYLFLGEPAREMAKRILSLPIPPSMQIAEIVRELKSNYIFSHSKVMSEISALKNDAVNNPSLDYFILIRCPDELPYRHVIEIIEALSGLPNLLHGCVGGVMDEITQAKRIYQQRVTDGDGTRTDVVFEF